MYNAYIVKNGQKINITVNEYNTNYRRENYSAHCRVCNQEVILAADNSPKTRTHFRHRHLSVCPTIEDSRQRYIELHFRHFNDAQKNIIIETVKENLSKIYCGCKRLCNGSLYYKEFRDLLEKASQQRVWEYRNIEIQHIPYCLLTLKLVFKSLDNKNRDSSFFFCFDNDRINIENTLWIDFQQRDILLLKYDFSSKEILKTFQVNNNYLDIDLQDKTRFYEKEEYLKSAIF